jgi:hypothetical protein
MKQRPPYTRISELLESHRATEFATSDCESAVVLIEKIFRCVDDMALAEREALMKRVAGWVIGTKFGSEKAPVLIGLHRYCVAANIIESPAWEPPKLRL